MNWSGASHFNRQQMSVEIAPFGGMNAFAYFMDRWHQKDPLDPNSEWIPGKYPSTVSGGAPNNVFDSSFWLLNGTYLRLKTLSISFDLSCEFLKSHGVQNLVVLLSGQNLLTLSGLGPIDPENQSSRLSYYPQQKTYNIGFNIKF